MSTSDSIALEAFDRAMLEDGWMLFKDVIDQNMVDRLKVDLLKAYEHLREMQVRQGMADITDGAHHILGFGGSLVEFLDRRYLDAYITDYFDGGPYIINTFGGWFNAPGRSTYIENVHRDLRTFSGGYNLMINMLVMLDDFTVANGATYLLSGSHLKPEKPDADVFQGESARAIGTRGSIVLFNSNLWHAAAPNTSDAPRAALTLTFTKPFIKPQFDYCRYFDAGMIGSLSDHVRQLIGYNSRVPSSHEEWYQLDEALRFYQKTQG
jgi:Phytanoyl-CoA dioxygenase (PhyH)